ncbi:hypothetical protein [Micromonospora sp. NBRC 101691]|uniref:hypothetical protein n=1 Tax=Micromonospora sp. NBRC 101691 TaxID=3032198 RepID=UPI0024A10A0F|nr:hypothetical protein [Micromonospora sp. NBRC 101691]GLY22094.1 hypothetical protein Misp04_18260 [Micromonospora sp. NBRC 101691]
MIADPSTEHDPKTRRLPLLDKFKIIASSRTLLGGFMSIRHRGSARQAAITAGALLLATGSLVAATGQPAAAVIDYVTPTSVTWTDSRQPSGSFSPSEGTVPVGTWEVDGDKHTARAYFTFDLTPYRGQRIVSARAITGETTVNDCDRPREIELWRTDPPVSAPTWNTAPAVREKVADVAFPNLPCGSSFIGVMISEAVRQAVADGQDQLTLMARIAGDHEENKHYGRWIKNVGISLDHNTPPNVPDQLTVEGAACGTSLMIRSTGPTLRARVSDPDVNETGGHDAVAATFAFWPIDRPAERTEATLNGQSSGSQYVYRLPQGRLAHGTTYAFSVRASDQYDSSNWSPECRFTIDTAAPAAPAVSSVDYPAGWDGPATGGPGIPGSFTFTADSDDLAGFSYGEHGLSSRFVPVDASGRSATVSYAPVLAGPRTLSVYSVDRAGNFSEATSYRFSVRHTAPAITDSDPEAPAGAPRRFTFAPNMENVVEYTYRLNYGEEITVAADAVGTAQVTITPEVSDVYVLSVRSRTVDGLTSDEASILFWVPEAS